MKKALLLSGLILAGCASSYHGDNDKIITYNEARCLEDNIWIEEF